MIDGQEPALQENLARVAEQYDLIPYESKPFAKTHPMRLAGIARLFGLEAAPMARARVLELGCAAGGNIVPHAARFPDARFLGIDLGARQVEDGNARIARLGLTNIEIRCESITDLPADAGEFDYIVCHGVYSWVPEPVREAILGICQRHLAPNGIAQISYNVLPGWRMYQPFRDACRLLIPQEHDPATRVAMARELMGFLRDHTPDNGSYGTALRAIPPHLNPLPDDYIFHEYMEDTNFPCTFSDFADAAQRHDLGYLGECDLHLMLTQTFHPRIAQAIAERTAGDIASTEQMIDVLTGRNFRQTLLVRIEQVPHIVRALKQERIEALHFIAQYDMKLEQTGDAIRLSDANGRQMNANGKAIGRALERMLAALPSTVTLDDCAAGMSAQERAIVRDALFKLVISGMIEISAEAIPCGKAGARPKASAVARDDAAQRLGYTTNARHEVAPIDAAAHEILVALDGKTARKDLEKRLVDAALARRISLHANGVAITDPKELRRAVARLLPELLDSIAASGLLE